MSRTSTTCRHQRRYGIEVRLVRHEFRWVRSGRLGGQPGKLHGSLGSGIKSPRPAILSKELKATFERHANLAHGGGPFGAPPKLAFLQRE